MTRPDRVDEDLDPFADRWHRGVHHVDEGAGRPILMFHGNPALPA